MTDRNLTRRRFVAEAGAAAAVAGSWSWCARAGADPGDELPEAQPHTLTVISGKPRERGRQYGRQFQASIREFLDREIYARFVAEGQTRDDLLRYAGQCGRAVSRFSPEVAEELEGMAEGAGLRAEEAVLITLHEELYHRGRLPGSEHCTTVAAGPPDTSDGNTYVGQTWDWMRSLYGVSSMLLWKRTEGPSLLSYAYPGLWSGAGMNSAGVALCWTSAQGLDIEGPRVGIPSYALIAQMLYQETLEDAISEARRSGHAGWFTFTLADAAGQLASVEGCPGELAVETGRGHLARAYFGTRQMTRTADGQPVTYHPRCRRMYDLLEAKRGQIDRSVVQGFFGDHQQGICKHSESKSGGSISTIDAMLFNTTKREAHVARGPGCSAKWIRFSFT